MLNSIDMWKEEYVTKLPFNFDIEKLKQAIKEIETMASFAPCAPEKSIADGQICLTHTASEYNGKNNWYEGSGSLALELKAKSSGFDVRKLVDPPVNADFTIFNEDAKDTYFYEVYQQLTTMYEIGRVRIMQFPAKGCLSWHIDPEERIHVPIISNSGNILAILNKNYHLPANGSSYIANVIVPHSAFNGGFETRYNLLCDIISYKPDAVTNLKLHSNPNIATTMMIDWVDNEYDLSKMSVR